MPRTPLVFLAIAAIAGAVHAQEEQRPRPSVRAIALGQDETVSLDGRLDEPFWQRIEPASGFRQREPDEGAPATESTEVRIAYSRKNLYIGARLYDSTPDGIIGFEKRRDASLRSESRFAGEA